MAISENVSNSEMTQNITSKSQDNKDANNVDSRKANAAVFNQLMEFLMTSYELHQKHPLGDFSSTDNDGDDSDIDPSTDPSAASDSGSTDPDAQGDGNNGKGGSVNAADQPSSDEPPMDPLTALILSGITVQNDTNSLMTQIGQVSTQLSNLSTDSNADNLEWMKKFYTNGDRTASTPGTWSDGATGIKGASKDTLGAYVSIWQYIQQVSSSTSTQFQSVTNIPSTMMQTLTQSINTAQSDQQSTIQALGSSASIINGWAGV